MKTTSRSTVLRLTESEIRSVIRSELERTLSEGSHAGIELSTLVGDAMLDGLREVAVIASRNSQVRQIAQDTEGSDPRRLALKVVENLLSNDPDFRRDMVSLVTAMIKRAAGK